MASERINCWLLTDGAPGHESQSRGLADAIARFYPLDVTVVPVRLRRRLLKGLGRILLRFGGGDWLLAAAHDIDLPQGKPDLVISSGGNTLLANALLARRFRVPNLYSGTPKGFDTACYARIYTVTPQGGAGNVVLPLPPVPGALCAPLPTPSTDAPLLLLVGGEGGGLHYTDADWHDLAAQVNALAARTGRRWLVTTSRRTGAMAEDILAAKITPQHLREAVWWAREPRKVMREYLARAGAVYVTADSLTMVAEAIYAGRPVHVVRPPQGTPEAQDAQALQRYAAAGFVRASHIRDLAATEPFYPAAPVPDVQALIRDSVRELLP